MTHQLTLLAVHAHPDDATYKTGGIMARYAAEGVRVACITCTGGESGEIVVPELDTPTNRVGLAEIHAAELARALDHLGPIEHYSLGYRDSGAMGAAENDDLRCLWQADLDVVTDRIVRLVRTIEPDVIVSYNESGYLGDPDYVRAAHLAKAAFERAGDPAAFPEQLEGAAAVRPWTPRKLYELVAVVGAPRRTKVTRLLRERGLAALPTLVRVAARWRPRAERRRRRAASAQGETTTRVDIGPWLEAKHRALAEHRTQVAPNHPYLALSTGERRVVSPTEDFTIRLSRIDVHLPEDDLFAGLR